MDINDIMESIKSSQIRISEHADEEAHEDKLSFDEIFYSVLYGEVMENYPTDKPFSSCLILGKNFAGEPIHSVWAYNPDNGWSVLITVYRPDPDKWIDWKTRRK